MVKAKERSGVVESGVNKGVAFPGELGIVGSLESLFIKSTGCPDGCVSGRRVG